MKKETKSKMLLGLLLFSVVPKVSANVGVISIDSTTLEKGETKTLTINLPNNIASADGTITSSDPACVEVVNVTSQNGSGNYFMGISLTRNPLENAGTVTIRGLKKCEAVLNISNASLVTTSEVEESSLYFTSGKIIVNGPEEVIETPEAQNPGTEANNQSTSSNATKSTQSAQSVSADKTTQIVNNQGSNNTTANNIQPSKKEVTTNPTQISQVDTISNDGSDMSNATNEGNSLSSLVVSGYDIDFKQDTTTYTIKVDKSVEKLDVEALAIDQNAKVTIQGNDSLTDGENTVNVIVESVDGTTKTYTIIAIRDDLLAENDDITIKKSSNNYLKNITINNGELILDNKKVEQFDKKVTTYYYKKGENFSYKFETEDSNAKAKVVENGETINIVVEAENGDIKVYTLVPYKVNIIKNFVLLILGVIIGYLLRVLYFQIKRKRRRKKKLKELEENKLKETEESIEK